MGDPEIATRIASYEMADRLESSAPELMNLEARAGPRWNSTAPIPTSRRSPAACLLARRMVERGVRFINIYHEGWDAHSDLNGNHRQNCGPPTRARPHWCWTSSSGACWTKRS